jgi:hypothetical protein
MDKQLEIVFMSLFGVLLLTALIGYAGLTKTETAPAEEVEFADLSDEEKLDRLAASDASREDKRAFNLALSYQEASYCEEIENYTMRDACRQETPAIGESMRREPVAEDTLEPLRGVSSDDERRYNLAMSFETSTYCDEIRDDDLRVYCQDQFTT